jgi:hypothetical protein
MRDEGTFIWADAGGMSLISILDPSITPSPCISETGGAGAGEEEKAFTPATSLGILVLAGCTSSSATPVIVFAAIKAREVMPRLSAACAAERSSVLPLSAASAAERSSVPPSAPEGIAEHNFC